MKKSLNKVIVTLAAITALTAAMAVTASAAVTVTQSTADGKTTVTAAVSGKTAGEQVTMLVLKPGADKTDGIQEGEIAYIDQVAADAEGKAEFVMPIGETKENDKFELLSGSTTATEPDAGEVTIPSAAAAVHYGDVNDDKAIDAKDASQVMLFTINKGTIVGNDTKFACADVNEDKVADAKDASQIMLYTINKGTIVSKGLDSWMTK